VLHQHVFPGVLERLERSNIRDYSIFLGPARGDVHAGPEGPTRTLFGYLKYVGSDYAADMAAVATDETTRQWWTLTDPMRVPPPDRAAGGWWAMLPESLAFEGDGAGPAGPRAAIAFLRPRDLGEGGLECVRATVREFGTEIRALRAFAARDHFYVYLEASPALPQEAFAKAIDGALGGASNPTRVTEVFQADLALAQRKKSSFPAVSICSTAATSPSCRRLPSTATCMLASGLTRRSTRSRGATRSTRRTSGAT